MADVPEAAMEAAKNADITSKRETAVGHDGDNKFQRAISAWRSKIRTLVLPREGANIMRL